ncbi:MAG: Asp23/Gls24 family envelope stress response protein [Clostridiales bacterium]|nr:Asp23/Gls24 family envelope stress response protein [Clostridiales bacterium]
MSKEKGPDNKIIRELILESGLEAASKVDGIFKVLDVRADSDPDSKTVELKIYIEVFYGYKIPAVSWDVQNAVRTAVKNATGYKADKIDIHIQGVSRKPKGAGKDRK